MNPKMIKPNMFRPGTDYTEHVANQTGREVTGKTLFRQDGQWYKTRRFEETIDPDNPLASLCEYVEESFAEDAKLSEARAFEGEEGTVGFVRVVEIDPSFEVGLDKIGSLEDLKSDIREHASEFPDGDGVGYLDLENQLEELPEALGEDGETGAAFLISPVDQQSREAMEIAYSDEYEGHDPLPDFDLQLESRTFLNHENTIYEVKK
jgi:hypothetical protein